LLKNAQAKESNEREMSGQNVSNLPPDENDELLAGIKKASSHGATALPTASLSEPDRKDHTHDTEARCDYLPPPSRQHFIPDGDDRQQAAYESNRAAEKNSDAVNEFYVPILLAIVYFLFQLPFFKQHIGGLTQAFTTPAGNLSVMGILFASTLYGFLYYACNKGLKMVTINTHS